MTIPPLAIGRGIEKTPYKRKEVIGDCTLYLGDCLEILPTLGKVDAVVTDPPYGINYSAGGGGGGIRDKNGKRYAKKFTGKNLVIGDDKPFDPSFILALNVPTILWGGNHFASKLPNMPSWLVWDKKCGTATNDFADCEIAWSNLGHPARCLPHLWNGMLKDSERGVERVHPTQKPVAVMKWCLRLIYKKASPEITVTDLYMGSGTTLVACAKMGRRGIGIELEPKYFDIACRRVEEAYKQPDMFIKAPEPKPEQIAMEGLL